MNETLQEPRYQADATVDPAVDGELRELLSVCFPGTPASVFAAKRYFREMPAHRWLVRTCEGTLVAHAAVHDKLLGVAGGNLRAGGVAEVCVRPAWRGRGLVGHMMAAVHAWLWDRRTPYALLFGKLQVYGSSGYRPAGNPFRHYEPAAGQWCVKTVASALVRELGDTPWPEGEIDLRGPTF